MADVTRREIVLALFASACLTFGCRHAREVEQDEGNGEASKKEQGASGESTRTRVPPRAGRPAVSATPEGLMNPGSARSIQEALRSRGLLSEPPPGELDDATSAALRRFQRSEGLAATGAPDRETLRRLGVDPQSVYRTVPQGAQAEPKQ